MLMLKSWWTALNLKYFCFCVVASSVSLLKFSANFYSLFCVLYRSRFTTFMAVACWFFTGQHSWTWAKFPSFPIALHALKGHEIFYIQRY